MKRQPLQMGSIAVQRIGEGNSKTTVVPGLCGSPNDWEALAQEMRSQLFVICNPFHKNTGLDWKQFGEEYEWLDWWRQKLRVTIQALGNRNIITFSRGILDFLKIQNGLKFDSLTLLSPATAAILRGREEPDCPEVEEELERKKMLLHATLRTLCRRMDHDTYRTLLDDHFALFGERFRDIMRRESPTKTNISRDLSRELIADLPSNIVLSVLAGSLDPLHDRERTEYILDGRAEITSIEDAGHLLHVQKPAKTAQSIY